MFNIRLYNKNYFQYSATQNTQTEIKNIEPT